MWKPIQRWRDRRSVKRWIKSAGVDPVKLFTSEDERELVQILALLATDAAPELVEAEPGDPPPAGSSHEEELDRGGYWLKDWQDIVSEEVGVKRWGPI